MSGRARGHIIAPIVGPDPAEKSKRAGLIAMIKAGVHTGVLLVEEVRSARDGRPTKVVLAGLSDPLSEPYCEPCLRSHAHSFRARQRLRRLLARCSPISPDEAQRLVGWLREVVRSRVTDRDRELCRSILSHALRPGWHQSVNRAPWMERLVAQPQAVALSEDEGGR